MCMTQKGKGNIMDTFSWYSEEEYPSTKISDWFDEVWVLDHMPLLSMWYCWTKSPPHWGPGWSAHVKEVFKKGLIKVSQY